MKANGSDVVEIDAESNILDNSSKRPRMCHSMFDGNQEAEGLGWNYAGRGFLIMGGVFLSTALLSLAQKDAGCDDLEPGEECNGRTHGIRPSSLLTLIGSVSMFVATAIMPIAGAIVDHTDYRRAVLISSDLILLVINFAQASLSEDTWFFVAMLQLVGPLFYLCGNVVLFAYIPEITDDSVLQTKYNTNFEACRAICMIFSLVSAVILARVFPGIGESGTLKYEVGSARVAQVWVSTLGLVAFLVSFWKMKPRVALSDVPQGKSLLTTSFYKIGNTLTTVWRHHPTLFWFSVSIILIESVGSSFLTIVITYMVDFLGFNSSQVAINFLIILLGIIAGNKTLPWLTRKLGLLQTLKLSTLGVISLTLFTAIVVRGPEQGQIMYPLSFVMGYMKGSSNPNLRLIFLQIMPRGQESEMLGFYFFCSMGFSWGPPLLFTAINEAGFRTNYGLATMSVLPIIGFGTLHMMGQIESAVEHTRRTGKETISTVSEEKDRGHGHGISVK
eukprot:CAMPEP_0194395846 /NCGR_PEP_ID=MMETSP0174-20130528/124650_1 /TAXON_ID=216777 /ORGANISM="Proboscia alata, Strain PI-D3" /LENGTH=501 /DNA_ID=CAMNT_0039191827 /DNA_START=165 /DNA_END=1670 /DNA_ORIENTATION=-